MFPLFYIALGGAAGSVLRYWCAGAVTRVIGAGMPWGTLAVNVLGGLAIGLIAHLLPLFGDMQKDLRLLLVTGLLGGFTTFSAFSLEVFNQIERGAWVQAAFYVALSVLGAVGGVMLGTRMGRWVA